MNLFMVLFAVDFGNIVQVLILAVVALLWLISYLKKLVGGQRPGQNPRTSQPSPVPQFGQPDETEEADMDDEVSDFLRRAAQRRGTPEHQAEHTSLSQLPSAFDEEVVDGRDLDRGGVTQEDPGGLLAQAVRGLGVAATKDGVRTEAGGLGETHAGSDAVGAGSIGGGHDEVALVRHATDHERLAAELGGQHLLDRGEEGVHVEVQDAAGARDEACVATSQGRGGAARALRGGPLGSGGGSLGHAQP